MATSNSYFTSYPVLQVRPWGLLVYDRIEWNISTRKTKTLKDRNNNINTTTTTTANHITTNPTPNNNENTTITPEELDDITTNNKNDLSKNSYTGTVTPYAKKKLKRAIQLLVASAKDKEAPNFKTGKTFKFKVNFVTLTLPSPQEDITDKQIKKEVLDVFIKRLRRKMGLNNYVWRAERQKNGNLHFHMITDTYLHYEKLRNDWNACLNKFNFIDKFEQKHGHRNPNSTDIHAVWKVKNLTQYFIKYMAKDHKEGETIEGKIWDCSKNLKTKQNCDMLLETEAYDIWEKAYHDTNNRIKNESNYCLIFMDDKRFNQYVTGCLRDKWERYLDSIRKPTETKEPPVRTSTSQKELVPD